VAFRFALGGRRGDLSQPPIGIGHPDGQWDDHLPDQVSSCPFSWSLPQRDRHVDRQCEVLDGLSPAAQQLA
jgi:hypothetical protein